MVDVTVNSQTNKIVVVGESVASPVVVESCPAVNLPVPTPYKVEVKPDRFNIVATTGGVQGPAGEDGDKHYRHVQASPALQWVIDHPLGKYPAVSVVDSAGAKVEGHIQYVSQSRVVVTFTAAFAGEAFLN